MYVRMAGSKAGQLGVDVCLESLESLGVPHCPHGPTLLFERYISEGTSSERFYACSACRDRKDCSFYQRENEKFSEEKEKERKARNLLFQPKFSHEEYCERLKVFMKGVKKKFCHTCGLLLLKEEWKLHSRHAIMRIQDNDVLKPTQLLSPLENKKANAQYLFSNDTVEFMGELLEEQNCHRIICAGVPTLHEAILTKSQNQSSTTTTESILLDIDDRYGQFYARNVYARYNMFNHHFFDETDDEILKECFSGEYGESAALVIDPPFGGLVEVLAHNVKKIMSIWSRAQINESSGRELPVFWIFPYFMESRILKCLPTFTMLDYKVNYVNHNVFKPKDEKGSKHSSPVRIFTNVSPSKITLPQYKGYKWCSICQKFVSKENKHCFECNACTSKDGRQYTHCERCKRCVKPSKVHCDTCSQCQLPNHCCGQVATSGCHICGKTDHKRRECPDRYKQHRKAKKRPDRRTTHMSKKRKRDMESFVTCPIKTKKING